MSVKVFISYSSADRAEALAVRRLLTNRGCTVWLDVFDIRVAMDLKNELGEGIGNADVLCLLLSPTAVASRWVSEEIARGEEHANKRGMRLVAVLLRPCRPPDRLLGRVLLDATNGITSPDVSARLARAVLGAGVVGDMEIDVALQEGLQARQNEMEAALVLPELATQLEAVHDVPLRQLEIFFRHEALPAGKILAVSFTFDPLFSQPMWFLFAHYREGRTWPRWMKTMRERDHQDIRDDGKRIEGCFEWFDYVEELEAQIDGTDLRDLPSTFDLKLSGKRWKPRGSVSSYPGGPGVPHLEQKMEIPALSDLVAKKASFAAALLGEEEGSQEPVTPGENDLDIRIVGRAGEQAITLFRSAHTPLERAVLNGAFLRTRKSPIETEAILGVYSRPHEVAAADREQRRKTSFALLEKAEAELSPDERRVVGFLRYGNAKLLMFRIVGSSPPPGPAREQLHRSALEECRAVCRILGPLADADLRIDDVGMVFWAASSLADYYLKGRVPERAVQYAEVAAGLVQDAANRCPDEPGYRRWLSSGLARLAEGRAANGDQPDATKNLDESITIMRALYQELSTPGRRRDLRETVESALKVSQAWASASLSRQRWTELLGTLA
jgi:hypothetical protein